MRPEPCLTAETFGSPVPSDWQFFREWAGQEGWRVPSRELALFRQELSDSVFVLRDAEGRPVGFVTVCRQQGNAWVGNLIVDPARRGAGFGRKLFEYAVGTLSARGAAALWLTASVVGRPLYESCDFREAGQVERWVRRGTAAAGTPSISAARGDLPALVRADAAAWGHSRAELLALLARDGRIVTSGSTVALLQPDDALCVLGPWLSADHCPRSNRTVLGEALASCSDTTEIAADVIGSSPVRGLLRSAGFEQTGETVLMLRGAAGKVRLREIVSLASLGSLG